MNIKFLGSQVPHDHSKIDEITANSSEFLVPGKEG